MLVRTERRDGDALEALQADVDRLTALLRDRSATVVAVRADLEAFRARYQADVGRLHERLDELEYAIAEAELGELSRKLDEEGAGAGAPPADDTSSADVSSPRLTSDAVRKLFRDVAKLIHPDLADDPHGRDDRHALMVEATRAYARGDEAQLRWILEAWETRASTVPGDDPAALQERLARRVLHLDEQVARLDAELAAMQASPLWELKVMVDREAARGRDIVRDMVRRLERDILAATNRLEAMRHTQTASRHTPHA